MVIRSAQASGRKAAGQLMARRDYVATSAESTNYHLAPKGFWKKFRDAIVVNPEISTGLPLPTKNRYPQPASRPEKYSTPATQASDPAQNPYWKRDVRRQYPRLSVVDQAHLAQVLIGAPQPPSASGETAVATSGDVPELTSAIATVMASRPSFSPMSLPPKPHSSSKWKPRLSPEAPHDPQAYWPMHLYA